MKSAIMSFAFGCISLIFSCPDCLSGDNIVSNWKNIYGAYNKVAADSTGFAIAVGAGGRITTSNNNAVSWESRTSGTHGELIDVCILSPGSAAVCVKGGGVLQSHDFGSTWSPINFSFDSRINCVSSDSHGSLLVSSARKLYLVPSGSLDVLEVNTPDSTQDIVKSCIDRSGLIWIYLTNDVFEYYSTVDSVWRQVVLPSAWTFPNDSSSLSALQVVGTTLFIARDKLLAISYDFGNKWNVKSLSIATQSCVMRGGFTAFSNSTTIGTVNDAAIFSALGLPDMQDNKLSASQRTRVNCVALLASGEILAVGSNNLMTISRDSGRTLSMVSYSLVPFWDKLYTLGKHSFGLVGYHSFYVTKDDGATWLPEYFVKGTHKSPQALEAYCADSNTIYLRTENLFEVLKSTDGGISFDSLFNLGAGSTDEYIAGFGRDTVLMVENVGGIRTRALISFTINGKDWQKSTLFDSVRVDNFTTDFANRLYFTTRRDSYMSIDSVSGLTRYVNPLPVLNVTTSLGRSIERIDVPYPLDAVKIAPGIDGNLVIQGYDTVSKCSKILAYDFEHKSWQTIDSVNKLITQFVCVGSADSGILNGSRGILKYRKSLKGSWRNFTEAEDYLFSSATSIGPWRFIIRGGILSKQQGLLLIANLDALDLPVERNDIVPEYQTIKLEMPFPNPCRGWLFANIRYSKCYSQASSFRTAIYDSQGALIRDLTCETSGLSPEGGLLSIDVSSLSPGVYFLNSRGMNQSVSRMFVKDP